MSELDVFGTLSGTDKSSPIASAWDYLRHYERFFQEFRDRNINILEIGVLTGSSIAMWLNYFEKATVVGVDIDPSCRRFARDRVVIKIGSQEDPAFLHVVATQYEPTIVIDDGSHIAHHMIASFETLFPRVAPGGLYIFEDLSFHFEDGVGQWLGAKTHQGLSPVSIYDYLSRFIRARAANINTPADAWGIDRYIFEQIDSVTVFGGAIVVRKRAPRDFSGEIAVFERELSRGGDAAVRYSQYLLRHNVDVERAVYLLKDVLQTEKEDKSARSLLIEAFIRLRRLDEASKEFDELAHLKQMDDYLWARLAELQRWRGRPDLEQAALEKRAT